MAAAAASATAAAALPKFVTQHFINGEFVDSVSGKTFDVYNPATGEVLAKVADGDHRDVDKAVEAANKALESWKKTDGTTRRDLLLKLADLLEKNKDEMATLETLNNGKPIGEAKFDVSFSAECFRYYAGWADKIQGKSCQGVSGRFMAFTRHEPVGVCAQITPWNFSITMPAWKLAPALCCGCTVILKPAEQTPLTALRIASLVKEAGFPPGVVNVVCGFGPTAGAPLVEHPKVNKVAFTGSTEVGKIIMATAAKTLKRVTLELGGKSPIVIMDDADLDKAVAAATFGIFFNQGQVCTASSRVFVHEKIYDQFVAAVAEATKKKKQGPGIDAAHDIGPQVSAEQQKTVWSFIEAGKSEGARCVVGGTKPTGPGYFITPTVFADVRDDMKIAREEIFGPVMSIIKFSTLDEAITRANDTCYGLAAACISKNADNLFKFASLVQAGSVWLNGNQLFSHAVPFGGFKNSGIGRELGEYGLSSYTEVKTIMLAVDFDPVK